MSDELYAEDLKEKEVRNDDALYSSSTYKVQMTAQAEPAFMHSMVFLTDTGVPSNVTSAVFIEP